MFENIIGQAGVIGALSSELAAHVFPRAVLFFGPPYAGKLSTALEVARVLTCRQTGDWSCACSSCAAQRELTHPHTLLLGSRYWDVEIAASADALRHSPRAPTQFLFLRAVRKLLRRFDSLVWDADDTRTRSAQDKAARIEEMLTQVEPGVAGLPEGDALEKVLGQITAACTELASALRGDHIGIGQVRKLASWAHLTSADSLKVAIVENVDRMQESARNAMLKLLEEPPEGVRLILLSTHRSAIIPTVLSRLRPYGFSGRSPQEEQEVLRKIFRDESGRFAGLRAFFLAWKDISQVELSRLCKRFIELSFGDEAVDVLSELSDVLPRNAQAGREAALSFLEETSLLLQCSLRQGAIPVDTLEEWNQGLKEAQSRIETYNMSPSAVIESLFLRMRLSAHGGAKAQVQGAGT